MAVNEVKYGGQTILSVKNDTVTPDTLLSGVTAHDNGGNPITGEYTPIETLAELEDVDIESPTNGQFLSYNSTTEKWENADGAIGGRIPVDPEDTSNINIWIQTS